MVRLELTQIELITAGDVLEEVVHAQLHLRLPHLLLPALVMDFV